MHTVYYSRYASRERNSQRLETKNNPDHFGLYHSPIPVNFTIYLCTPPQAIKPISVRMCTSGSMILFFCVLLQQFQGAHGPQFDTAGPFNWVTNICL